MAHITQWEYRIVEAEANYGPDSKLEVMKVDESEDLAITRREGGGFFGENVYRYDLLAYLNLAGKEGWEVVGVSPIAEGYRSGHEIVVVLKRPIGREHSSQ